MKKLIRTCSIVFLMFNTLQGTVGTEPPIATRATYPQVLEYFGSGRYGGSNNLVSPSGIQGSIIIGQKVVENELRSENGTLHGSLGFYSYLLNVPDAPIVEAPDAASTQSMEINWWLDINSPRADGSRDNIPFADNHRNFGSTLSDDTWLITRKNLSDNTIRTFDAKSFDLFTHFDDDPPEVGVLYDYAVTTSNRFGHSKEGFDGGFRAPNGRYQGQVRVISSGLNEHSTTDPGPPVVGVEISLEKQGGGYGGSAADLTGASDKLYVLSNFSEYFKDGGDPQPVTFEVWFNIVADESGERYLLDMGADGIQVKFTSSSLITTYQDGTTIHTKPAAANDDGTTGWYHLAVVYDPDSQTLESSLYKGLDNSKDVQSASATGTAELYHGNMVFGADIDGTSASNLNGYLDEIRFWATARNAEDIDRNRNRSLQLTDSGTERVDDLMGYWKLDEKMGTASYDMADLDDETKDWKQKLHFANGADWSETIHSEVKLSGFTEPTEGRFDIKNILYSPGEGQQTIYQPSAYLLNHNDIQPSAIPPLELSIDNAEQLGVWLWDHSLFKVDGNIKYDNTLYSIKDVEILIQYGHLDGVGNWVPRDMTFLTDTTSDRYRGKLTKYAPRTYTDTNGNYELFLEPGITVRLYAAYGGRWEQTEDYEDSNSDGQWNAPETYTDSNENEQWDPDEAYDDSNENGQWDPGEPFTDIDGDGFRDLCEDIDIDSDGKWDAADGDVFTNLAGECYKDGHSILNVPQDGDAEQPYHEIRQISNTITEMHFADTQLDTISIFVGGDYCGFSIGNIDILVNTDQTMNSQVCCVGDDWGSSPNTNFGPHTDGIDSYTIQDNGETLAESFDIYVPPIPLYFEPIHNDIQVSNLLKDPENPTGGKRQWLDLSDGPNSNDEEVPFDNYSDHYEIEWVYNNPDLTIERGDFYTVSGTALTQWNAQSGDDRDDPDDDVPLPSEWGLLSQVETNNDVSLYEEPYDDVATMYVRQGGYASTDPVSTKDRSGITIFNQGDKVFTEFDIYADYSDLNSGVEATCPCEEFTFTLADNISDSSMSLVVSNAGDVIGEYPAGKVFYQFTAAIVNTGGQHTRNIIYHAQQGSRQSNYITFEAYILGLNKPSAVGGYLDIDEETNPIPLYILRDPPGDQSFAYIEQGETFCQEYSFSSTLEDESGDGTDISLGVDITSEAGIALGAYFSIELDADVTSDDSDLFTTTNYSNTTESNIMCMTANETFTTSNVEAHSPLLSDLYIGSAMVINSGLASRLYVEEELEGSGCNAVPCMKIKQEMTAGADGFTGQFVYSEWFIVNSLLPEIYNNIQYYNTGVSQDPLDGVLWWQESRREEIWFLYGMNDGYDANGYLIPPQSLPELPGADPNADSLVSKVDLYNHWVSYVQRNQTLKAEATNITSELYIYPESIANSLSELATDQSAESETEGALPSDWSSSDFGLPDVSLPNIFISGGSSYLYEFENTTEATNSVDFSFSTSDAWESVDGFHINGMGEVWVEMEITNKEYTNSEIITQSHNRKVGIFFQDGEILDNFNVEIKMDDTRMPVYEVTSGRSSNPWEPTTSTLKVDLAEVSMSPGGTGQVGTQEAGGPAADSTVVFSLQLKNLSEAEFDRYYMLFLDNSTNPGGVTVSNAAGVQAASGFEVYLTYNVPFGVDLGITRGLVDYAYENLKFYLAAPYENEVAATWNQYDYTERKFIIPDPQNSDTQELSVYYTRPCQDLSILVSSSVPGADHDNEEVDFVINKSVSVSIEDQGGLPMTIYDYDLTDANLVSMELQWITIGGLDEEDENQWGSVANSKFEYKGSWATDTEYAPGDVVLSGANYYRCKPAEGHISGQSFAGDATKWETLADGGTQYTALWPLPSDGDGQYYVRAKSVCTMGEQVSYSPSVRVLIDTHGPQIVTATPIDHVLNESDQISFQFNEFVKCDNIDQTARLVDLDNTNETGNPNPVTSIATCFENEVFIHIDPAVSNYLIENHDLEAQLGGDGLEPIYDLYGNQQENLSGDVTDVVSWSFMVDRNPIRWNQTSVNEVIYNEVANSFPIVLRNNGTQAMAYDFGTNIGAGEAHEVPWWILPSPGSGVINPSGEVTITLDIDPNLQTGTQVGTLYAETNEGDEPLDVELMVLCPPPPHWDVDAYDYLASMTLITNVQYMESSVIDAYDKLVAIIDGEVRGVSDIGNMYLNYGQNWTMITVYSGDNSGEQVSFRLWDSDHCSERWDGAINSDGEEVAAIAFRPDSTAGTFAIPVAINFTDAIARNIDVSSGYTMVSFNLENDDMSLGNFLTNFDLTEGDRVIGSNGYATWAGSFGWQSAPTSGLTVINPLKTYILDLQAPDQEIYFVGNYIDPEHDISLENGWNWFSYLPNQPRPMNTTVFHLVPGPSTGDIVKSQFGFIQYVDEDDLSTGGLDTLGHWLGSLDFFNPGQGYKTKLAAENTILTFGEQTNLGRMMSGSSHLVDVMRLYDELEFDPHLYEHTMNIIAVLESDTFGLNDPEDQVITYDGEGIIRGISQPIYIAALDQHRLFMTLYANEAYGEELSMRFYDSSEDIWYYCQDHILFAANGITGSILDPMMISLSPLSIGDRGYVPDTYVLSQNYPNPFNPVTSIGFGVPEPADVTVMIYNILGQEVRELYRGHMQPGYQFMKWDGKDMFGTPGPSGMYIVVMQAGEFMDTKKVILLK